MGIVRDLYYARKMSAGLKLPAPTVAQLIKRMFLASTMESGEKATVTGEAPITLTLALAKNLISLTQYGLCSQASTPDPETPVGIKCNNGELKAVDDELPAGYKRVLGFTCNNNAMWEITDFHLKGSDTVRISFSVTAACNVFGCYQGTDATDNYDLYVSTTANSKYLRYGDGTYLSYWSSANLGKRFDVVYSPTGTQGMPDDSTWTEKSFTSANDLLIGSTTTTGTSSKLKGDLYGNIEVDGRLKLIPCERLSDNVLGYYDTYSETFYEPATGFTGAVSLGYDGSHYVLDVVGTPEVLTLTGKNLLNPATNTTGYYISSSGSISSGDDAQYTDLIPVEVGEDYTVSLISNREGGGNNRLHGYDANGDWVQQIVYGNTGIGTGIPWQKTATIPSGIAYVRLSYGIDDDDAMIEKSGKKTTYQPYVAPQTASVVDLFAVGDYADTQEIISGLIDRKIDFVILDGTEDGYGTSSAYGAAVYIGSASTKWKANRNGGVLCTHFTQGTASGTQPENACFFNASGHFYFRTSKTTAQFKTWIAEQYAAGTPVMVMFVRSTPTTESVTPQPLTTAEGTNYITVTAEVSPISLAAEYMKERGELKTVSGAMVHITDALAKAAKGVLASIEPVQDLHGYANPWPAGGGENKFDLAASFTEGDTVTDNGITATYSNGMLHVTGTNTGGSAFNIVYKNISGTLGAGTYICGEHLTVRASVDGGSNINYSSSFTATSSVSLVAFYVAVSANATNIDWNIPMMIVSGSTRPTEYSPYSNICPISGLTGLSVYRTGKNLCSMADQTFVQYKEVEVDEIPAGSYTYSAVITSTDTDSSLCSVVFLDSGKTTLYAYGMARSVGGSRVSCSFTVASPIKYIRIYAGNGYPSSAGDTATFTDNMIEVGSPATTYEAFSGNTYSVDWTTEAGTVYGGTLDVVTGVLTVDRAKLVFDGSNDEDWVAWGYWYAIRSVISGSNYYISTPMASNMFKYRGVYTSVPGQNVGEFLANSLAADEDHKGGIWNRNISFRFGDDITSVSGLRTWLSNNPIEVIFPLSTPQTYQLTAQEVQMLLGENYVWSSSGDSVSVTYLSDGSANNRQALRILLGDNYSNPGTPDDASDKEALDILLGR